MDLPPVQRAVSSTATPWRRDDPRRRLWGPVTVRVVWELVVAGIRVRPPVIREVREHALWLVRPDAEVHEAEAWAAVAVRDWLARVDGVYAPVVAPDVEIAPSVRWREAIHNPGDVVHDAVFRLYYGDGVSLEAVEQQTRIDGALLRGAREAVREMARQTLAEDGVDVAGWEAPRLDRLIARIAVVGGDQCPGPGGLATDPGRAHAAGCPRCTRILRLLREGLISPSDLFPPEDSPCLPEGTLDLVLVQVQPERRRWVRGLLSATGGKLLDRDTLVLDLGAHPGADAPLRELAERGQPAAAHLRVVRRAIRGRWGRRVILGGAVVDLLGDLKALPWGEVRGVEKLPEVAPPPPSAARWWTGAGLFAVLALLAGILVSLPESAPPEVALEATGTVDGVRFDAAETAYVDVVAIRSGVPSVVFHSVTPADKGDLATGDGRYALVAAGDAFVVVGAASALVDLERVASGFAGDADADALAGRVRDRYPTAAVEVVRAAAATP